MVECSGADAAAQIVKNIYLKEIQMYGMEQVQILSPYKVRSAAGVLELNRSLQDEVNPPVSGKRELHLGGEIFREGDRILQNKNTEFASNGDLGTLVQIAEDEDNNPLVQIVFTDGRRVKYEAEQVEMIEHANAITIHKKPRKRVPGGHHSVVKSFLSHAEAEHLLYGNHQGKTACLYCWGMESRLSGNPHR